MLVTKSYTVNSLFYMNIIDQFRNPTILYPYRENTELQYGTFILISYSSQFLENNSEILKPARGACHYLRGKLIPCV